MALIFLWRIAETERNEKRLWAWPCIALPRGQVPAVHELGMSLSSASSDERTNWQDTAIIFRWRRGSGLDQAIVVSARVGSI
jgi:hypothetical protein